MTDYFNPRPALLIATNRSGGTFLMNCLDSHPQISCERSEPLNPGSPWMVATLNNRETAMRLCWGKPGYAVAMFKLTYKHLTWIGYELIKEIKPIIIHLHREDILRMAVSSYINSLAAKNKIDYPVHTFQGGHDPPLLEVDPVRLIGQMKYYLKSVKAMRKNIDRLDLPALYLTYTDLVGDEGNEVLELPNHTRSSISNILRVNDYPMYSLTKRVNPFPFSQLISNWEQVREAINRTEFKKYLGGENG